MKIALILFLIFSSTLAFSAPMPPAIAVNHSLTQCAEIFTGDECMSCEPPEGWEILGDSFSNSCPEDYEQVEVDVTCAGFKKEFCCTASHSGANGDCDDVIVNTSELKCAFVEDIENCESLPINWTKPLATNKEEIICPSFEYAWEKEFIECTSIPEQTDLNVNAPIDYSIKQPFPLGLIFVLLVIGIILIYYKIKK